MNLTAKTYPLTGNPSSESWSQTFSYPEKIIGNEVSVFINLKDKNKIYFDKAREVKDLADKIFQLFKQKNPESQKSSLELFENAIQQFGATESLSVCLLSIGNGKIDFYHKGDISCYIFREEKVGKLFGSVKEASVVTGKIEAGDRYLIGTSIFFEKIPKGVLRAAFDNKNPKEFLTNWILQGEEDVSGVALKIVSDKQSQDKQLDMAIEATNKGIEGKAPTNLLPEGGNSSFTFGNNFNNLSFDSKDNRSGGNGEFLAKPNLVSKKENKLISFISKYLPDKKVRLRRDKFVELEKTSKRKNALYLGVIMITLLLISVGAGYRLKIKNDKKLAFDTASKQVDEKIGEAKKLALVDRGRAKNSLEEAGSIVADFKKIYPDLETVNLSQKIDAAEADILKQHTSKGDQFIDLSLVSDNFEFGGIAGSADLVFIFDSKGKKIIEINKETKRTEVIAGPSLVGGTSKITTQDNSVFLLKSKEVLEAGSNSVQVKLEDDPDLFYVYGSSLYFVYKNSSRIVKHKATATGFSSGEDWLKDMDVNLSEAHDIAIDGTIWILENSSISKFVAGNKSSFRLHNLPYKNLSFTSLFTDEQNENLYVLVKESGKILVFNKEGDYQEEYASEDLKESDDIVVSEKLKKIFFVQKDKLKTINLE